MDRVGGRLMPKRRSMILGLGALAMGSGAAFTSAAFENSVDAGADMRVIVDERLIVRAGDLFDSLSAGEFNDNDDPFTAVVSEEGSETPTSVLFEESDTLPNEEDTYKSVLADEDEDRIPTPAAVVNDGENGDFAFAIAVDLNENVSFDGLIEIENQFEDSVEAGITFAEFGADASDVSGGKEIVATEVYRFKDSEGEQISTDSDGWDNDDDQEPADRVTIGATETEQLTLQNDTGGGSVSSADLRSAIAGDGTPAFGRALNDIDLVNTIEVGIGES